MNTIDAWYVRIALAILVLALTVSGQTPAWAQGDNTVTLGQVDTSHYPQITLYANVTDPSKNQVGGLKREDFQVTEDGVPVDLVDFTGSDAARPVEIVFVFDTTGSMRNQIETLKSRAVTFARQLQDKKRDYALGLVAFGDEIRGIFREDGSLTSDVAEFTRWVSALRAIGGGDDPENALGAIKAATAMKHRDGAQRIEILITDAPPHHLGDGPDEGSAFTDPDLTVDRTTNILRTGQVTLYAVTNGHSDFQRMTRETNGESFPITADFSKILDSIATTVGGQYRLVYRSPRPTYDGTQRNIVIRATGAVASASGDYLEKHIVNMRSSDGMALGFLVLLLLLLAAPTMLPHRHRLTPIGRAIAQLWQRLAQRGAKVPAPPPPARPGNLTPTIPAQPSPAVAPTPVQPSPVLAASPTSRSAPIDRFPFRIGGGPADNLQLDGLGLAPAVAEVAPFDAQRLILKRLQPGVDLKFDLQGNGTWSNVTNGCALQNRSRLMVKGKVVEVHDQPWRIIVP